MHDRNVGDFFDIPPIKYEYLDHPSDIQIHAWGDTLSECFEQAAIAMFAYMTDIETVDIQTTQPILADGHDLESLLYNFLHEFLYHFSAESYFTARKIKVTSITLPMRIEDDPHINHNGIGGAIMESSNQDFKIEAKGFGETFDLKKHPQGTEIKAITYSCLQIVSMENGGYECYVIVDI